MPRVADVAHHYSAANLAGVVDDDVPKPKETLGNTGRNRDVLDFAQRDVSRGTSDEASVNFKLGIGQGVAHHVSFDVVVGGNQQERKRQGN